MLILAAGCRKAPAPPQPAADLFKPYHFDDEFQCTATVSASPVPSSALMADPIVWHNFNSENDITWMLLRGRMGFRQGDLVVKGEGSTPVIQAPGQPVIDWSRYEAVEARMLAEGGHGAKNRHRSTVQPESKRLVCLGNVIIVGRGGNRKA